MANRADAPTSKMKIDLNLTTDQAKNWSGFASAMQDFSKKQGDRRNAMCEARAQLQEKFDVLDQIYKSDVLKSSSPMTGRSSPMPPDHYMQV
jgi:hypothetical protein